MQLTVLYIFKIILAMPILWDYTDFTINKQRGAKMALIDGVHKDIAMRSVSTLTAGRATRNAVHQQMDLDHQDENTSMGAGTATFLYGGCLDAPDDIPTGQSIVDDEWPYVVWTCQETITRGC